MKKQTPQQKMASITLAVDAAMTSDAEFLVEGYWRHDKTPFRMTLALLSYASPANKRYIDCVVMHDEYNSGIKSVRVLVVQQARKVVMRIFATEYRGVWSGQLGIIESMTIQFNF